ncbi:MAG: hypothetical protein E7057_08300 [Lentisphaerae bacterium]|nr:hypothetical protein [Lentisphaerota bacterium]
MQQQSIANGGVQFVPQIAVQYVYLDFDGELTDYNGEILTIEDVEVRDPQLTQARIADILAELNKKYASQNVIFVTEKPEAAEYSTIFIGKTEAFDQYGNFAGLAETVDFNNQNRSDNAFVNLDSTATNEQIISTISHETDHLLGTLDHGGDELQAYADYYTAVNSGTTYTGLAIFSGDVVAVYSSGIANNAIVHSGGNMEVWFGGVVNSVNVNRGELDIYYGGRSYDASINSSGICHVFGQAQNTTIRNGGRIYISSGGVASGISLSSAWIDVYSGGAIYDVDLTDGFAAANATVHYGGYASAVQVRNGVDFGVFGYAENIFVSGAGQIVGDDSDLFIHSGASVKNVTVYSGGHVDVLDGGLLYGKLQIMSDAAKVIVFSGGIIDFTLTNRSSSDGYLINNLALISGTPTYAITVSANQGIGTYKLAQGASNFIGITIGTDGRNFGTLFSNGSSISNGNNAYRLTERDGNLQLTVTRNAADLNINNYQVDKSSISTSESVKLTFTVNNTGTKTTADSTLKIYDGERFLREITVNSLAPDASRTYTVTIPSGELSVGPHKIYVVVDANGSITESDENNNRAYRTVNVVKRADLRMAEYNVSSNSITTKDSVKLTFKVYNDGDADAPASMIKVYDGDRLLREVALGEIVAKGYRNCTITLTAGKLSVGTHKVNVVLDSGNLIAESNENNNNSHRTIFVKAPAAKPDLRMAEIGLSKNSITTQESVKLTFKVYNDGNADAPASTIKVYDGDRLLREVALGEIDAGSYRNCYITIPAGKLSVGTHKVNVVLDAGNGIAESREDNNNSYRTIFVKAATAQPDLRMAEYDVSSNSITTQESVKLTFKVYNDGDVKAAASTIKVYDGDRLLREVALGEIDAKGYRNCYITLTAGKLSVGTHKVNVVLDSGNLIAESNESNNNSYRTIFVKEPVRSLAAAAKDDNSWDVCGTGSVDALCGGNYADLGEWSLENSAALTRSAADILTTDKEESRLLNSGKLAG